MTKTNLPFYELFEALRKSNEFSLGIGEYYALLEALQGGFGTENGQFVKEKLFTLCKLLWLKPNQSYAVFENYFEEYYPLADNSPGPPSSDVQNDSTSDNKVDKPSNEQSTKPSEEQKPESRKEKMRFNVVDNKKAGDTTVESEHTATKIRKFLLTDDYLPLQKRQIQQQWSMIPQKRKAGDMPTLDIARTIRHFAQKGFLTRLYHEQNSEIINHIVVLTDHEGSMIAFETLNELLVETLQAAFPHSKSEKSKVTRYYFYNVPQDHVYKNASHTKYITLQELLRLHQNQRVAIVIISDAGAARGSNSDARVRATIRALFQLKKMTRKIVWLNPMPRTPSTHNRWSNTSAARIANFVQMFDTSLHDLQQAALFIKGKTTLQNL